MQVISIYMLDDSKYYEEKQNNVSGWYKEVNINRFKFIMFFL